MLNINELESILGNSFDKYLFPNGFTRTIDLEWEKAISPDFSAFFSLKLVKGDLYIPTWGISLKFGHKVNKKSTKDLIYDPIDYFKPFTEWAIPMATYDWKNIDEFANRAIELAAKASTTAQDYLSHINNLHDLAEQYKNAEAYQKYKRFDFYNYPQQVIAYAFVLKKAGDVTNAQSYLQTYFEKYHIDENTKLKLIEEFDQL